MNEQQSLVGEDTRQPGAKAERACDHRARPAALVGYLAVWGMECPRCARRVRDELLRLDGVLTARVFFEDALVMAVYDPHSLQASDLTTVIAAASNMYHYPFDVEVLDQGRAVFSSR
ncbi:MAG: heavy-metal-associated domain-containing protein [Ardenticatenaceae bacterium]|nr:heavy-metal-associated domain-containing protein [Ardenticatenaceae bacterium]